jgi:hypothetical protein
MARWNKTTFERFLANLKRLDNGCWEWQGSRTTAGYGNLHADGELTYAHRFSYDACNLIPLGKRDCHHLCEYTLCVNPYHLLATDKRNHVVNLTPKSRSYINARVTHCPSGHRYDEKNTYISKRGRRDCRRCTAIRNKATTALHPGRTSKYSGVMWSRLSQTWRVSLTVKGQQFFFGHFADEDEAAYVVDQVRPQLIEAQQTLGRMEAYVFPVLDGVRSI